MEWAGARRARPTNLAGINGPDAAENAGADKHQIMGPWGFWDRPMIVQYSVRLKKEAVPVHGRLVERGGVRRDSRTM
jgi:hypothetical protein